MTERKPQGMSFETWVERQITQAQAKGQFDHLPGAGKPLPPLDPDESAYEWVVAKARRENLDLFGMLPPGLALRKEREDLPLRASALPAEEAVRALAEDFNARVQDHWRRPQLRADVVPGMVDVEELVAGWRRARAELESVVPDPVAPGTVVPELPAARFRRWIDRLPLPRRSRRGSAGPTT